jgi:hypothetical protein
LDVYLKMAERCFELVFDDLAPDGIVMNISATSPKRRRFSKLGRPSEPALLLGSDQAAPGGGGLKDSHDTPREQGVKDAGPPRPKADLVLANAHKGRCGHDSQMATELAKGM